MKIVLRDSGSWNSLLPLTYTRSVADIRIGIMTIREKWETLLGYAVPVIAHDYLAGKYPFIFSGENLITVDSSVLPSAALIEDLSVLKPGQQLECKGSIIAKCFEGDPQSWPEMLSETINTHYAVLKIEYPWDIFHFNKEVLEQDFQLLTQKRSSAQISSSNTLIGDGKIFIEEGAVVEASIINTTDGSVYIGKNAQVMEGCLIRGGFALCEGAHLKMGAKIYGATTVGPFSKVGGELNNSVIFGYSNKAHDGFLGNSVIGEWCNLGADTNNSNLKNNYGEVKVYSIEKESSVSSGLTFCGLIMGDHSKSGINTMFNTGTVVGVAVNIFGGDFPPKYIPSFSWGGSEDMITFDLEKALDVSRKVMSRRNVELNAEDEKVMRHIFHITQKHRI